MPTRSRRRADEDTYAEKRSFDQTPEPPPEVQGNVDPGKALPGTTFVIQQHHARRLHFDLRLEMLNGSTPVLVSWAVPKNLPIRKGKPRLAVHVEDHPFEYGSFSGTIPEGNYGAGEVRIFDSGDYELLQQDPGKLTFRLRGRRMKGIWHLFKTSRSGGEDWMVVLMRSERPDPEPLPDLSPMLATLVDEPFDDDNWLFEPKWDGVRALAVCGDEETMLLSRNGRDVTSTYPELQRLHERLVALDAVVDGEIVAFEEGRPSFEKLQGRMNLQERHAIERAVRTIPVSFIVFDVLYMDGRSLVGEPLERRKSVADDLVVPSATAQVSTYVEGDGCALYEAARASRLEGIVAKKKASPYRPGRRTKEWLKVKTTYDADVVIGGWSPGEGSRSSTLGALLVGAHADDGLRFVGSVGTGFSEKVLDELCPRLLEIETPHCPFTEDPSGSRSTRFGKTIRRPRWIEPKLVARVEFRELTSAGKLRAPSFKGLRHDVTPEACRFEGLLELAEAATQRG